MDINSLALFQMADKKMDWLSEKQKTTSVNVANVDTPGFKARELKPIDFSNELKQTLSSNPYITNPNHLSPSNTNAVITNPKHKLGVNRSAGDFKTSEIRKPYETTITKNSVNLEEQMNIVRKTTEQYNATTSLYKKYSDLIKTSLGKN